MEGQEILGDNTCNGHTFLVPLGDSICPASLFNHMTPHAPPLSLGQAWRTLFHSVPTKYIYTSLPFSTSFWERNKNNSRSSLLFINPVISHRRDLPLLKRSIYQIPHSELCFQRWRAFSLWSMRLHMGKTSKSFSG